MRLVIDIMFVSKTRHKIYHWMSRLCHQKMLLVAAVTWAHMALPIGQWTTVIENN